MAASCWSASGTRVDSIALYQMDIETGKRVLVLPNVQEARYYEPGRILWLNADGTVRYADV